MCPRCVPFLAWQLSHAALNFCRFKQALLDSPGWESFFEGRGDDMRVQKGGTGWRKGVTDHEVVSKYVKIFHSESGKGVSGLLLVQTLPRVCHEMGFWQTAISLYEEIVSKCVLSIISLYILAHSEE